jgi:hypothetical protein
MLGSKQQRGVGVILYGCFSAILRITSWSLRIWYARSAKLSELRIAGLLLLLLGPLKCPLQNDPHGGQLVISMNDCDQRSGIVLSWGAISWNLGTG